MGGQAEATPANPPSLRRHGDMLQPQTPDRMVANNDANDAPPASPDPSPAGSPSERVHGLDPIIFGQPDASSDSGLAGVTSSKISQDTAGSGNSRGASNVVVKLASNVFNQLSNELNSLSWRPAPAYRDRSQGSSGSMQSLDMEAQGETSLRGLRASIALTGCGSWLRSPDDMSHLTEAVERIDDFWSYSRHGPREDRIMMLILYYNGLPSAVAGFMAAAAVALVLPEHWFAFSQLHGIASLVSGMLVSIVVLIFWKRRRTVFLDQACISQVDETKKRDGILSLGYFLKHSDNFMMQWDGTYFSRLWCVFEVAVHLRAHLIDAGPNLIFMPTVYGKIAAAIGIACASFMVLARIVEMTGNKPPPWETTSFQDVVMDCVWATFIVMFLAFFLSFEILQLLNTVKKQLRELSTFSTKEAKCFCCSVGHRHPETGETIDCDRILIERSVTNWFGSVDKFDDFVHNQFVKNIPKLPKLAYSLVLYTLCPVLWEAIGFSANLLRKGLHAEAMKILLQQFTQVFVLSPVQLMIVFLVFQRYDGYTGASCQGTSSASCRGIAEQLLGTLTFGAVYFCVTFVWYAVSWEFYPYGFIPLLVLYGSVAALFYRK